MVATDSCSKSTFFLQREKLMSFITRDRNKFHNFIWLLAEPSVALSAASFHAPSTPGIREGFHVTRRVGAVNGFTATAHTNGWPLNLKDKKKPVESFGLSHLKSDTHL